MVQSGLECDFDLTQMAVMGFAEVLPKLREFFRLADQATQIFRSGAVDGVVLVDFPGFNWHIAKRAKQCGLPVVYYLPPQLWAWGSWRIRKIRKYVDRVLASLPFENEWYADRHVPVEYVGHPFFDLVEQQPLDARFLQHWKHRAGVQVAVLPGSRNHEVHHIWPLQLEVIRRLSSRFPTARFTVAAYRDAHALWCRQQLSPSDRELPIEIFVGKTSELIHLADCALMKSGSVSLEMMARATPAVVLYRVPWSTYCIGKMLVRCKSMTLPNLIADETIMPEFMSVGNPEKTIIEVAKSMDQLLGDPEVRKRQRDALRAMALQYAQPGASAKGAQAILDLVDHRHTGPRSGRQAA
jgi:lipid-A-disaccharide synthase